MLEVVLSLLYKQLIPQMLLIFLVYLNKKC